MAKLTIICGDETYRLSHNGNEGDETEYGDPAFLTSGPRTYMALVCEDEHGDRYTLLEGDDWAVEVKAVEAEFGEAESELEETDDNAGDSADEFDGDDTDGEPDED